MQINNNMDAVTNFSEVTASQRSTWDTRTVSATAPVAWQTAQDSLLQPVNMDVTRYTLTTYTNSGEERTYRATSTLHYVV